MISVEEARRRLLAPLKPLGIEQVALSDAAGRVLAEPVAARRTQPPWPVSAMDGYAVRAADVARVPVRLSVIGSIPAGQAFAGTVGRGEAVRIFTGAPVPEGADSIVIQEDTERQGEIVEVREAAPLGQHVRPAGLDFREGEVGLTPGRRLNARDIGLAAAMNRPWLMVYRRPRIAILPTGDEVVMPGDPVGPNQIVSSNGLALAALVTELGGLPLHLPIAPDKADALQRIAEAAIGADFLVTTGGASVGEHDLVRDALGAAGLTLDFWKIAMRPGKPLMVGRYRETPMMGLPGNPVSSLVCGLLFLKPAIERLTGLSAAEPP
ncbi:MAG TPA: gephyrin-like molybdotransferase Glp, partial [Stellaceae bacterium]|nr:gephyrin-like molybdotransferase Glp [Stellaceae bacterium]